MEPFFSIVVVCLNPGEKLKKTLESIQKQTFRGYQVVVKDGGSSDGSVEALAEFWKKEEFYLLSCRDLGIYDAMNQALAIAEGKYVYYLNCGDLFYSEDVLAKMAEFIGSFEKEDEKGEKLWGIYYGNILERMTGQKVASNPHMDAFGCYRNVPCHQACFYSRELLRAHPFDTSYRVRADYEQFLWSYFATEKEHKVRFAYTDLLIADYEGGGFSETRENRRISAMEHKKITKMYMPKEHIRFRVMMLLSLAPLRKYLAESKATAGFYNRWKGLIYARKSQEQTKTAEREGAVIR